MTQLSCDLILMTDC